jgi:hypothetical protein
MDITKRLSILTILAAILIEAVYSAVKTTCPKMSCSDKLDANCAVIKADNQTNSTNMGEFKTCTNSTQYCPVAYTQLSTADAAMNITCKNVDIAPTTSRYPGEACDDNNKCKSGGNCTSSKCPGIAKSGNCTSDSECIKGNFCNGTVCAAQVAKDGVCSKSTACVNTAACYNKKCIE